MSNRSLFAYQVRVVREILGSTDDLLVVQPTGSGKTTVLATAAVAGLARGRHSHALIAAPQLQIEAGFTGLAGSTVSVDGDAVPLSAGCLRPLSSSRRVRALLEYLRHPDPGFVATVSHQVLGAVPIGSLPDRLHGQLLVVDEAHHAAEVTRLGRFVVAWRERGGRVVAATATDFRTDGEPVLLTGMRVVARSLAEHLHDPDQAGPFAPPLVESEAVPVDLLDHTPTAAEVEGAAVAPEERHQDRVARRMAAHWAEAGRPKTIVRVPVLAGGCQVFVGRLVAAFHAVGARVYDATGSGTRAQRAFQDLLARERAARAPGETHDVIIGVQRVVEGSDWSWCSDVYVVGLPGSLPQIVQLLGRATRRKAWPGYPAGFAGRAKITFFVPTGGSARFSLDLDHSRKLLALSSFLAGASVPAGWLLHQDLRRGYLRSLGGRPGDASAVFTPVPDRADDMMDFALAQAALAVVVARSREAGHSATVGELRSRLESHPLLIGFTPEERSELIARALVAALGTVPGRGEAVGWVVAERAARGVPVRPGAADETTASQFRALAAVWGEVLDEFRAATLAGSEGLAAFERQVHRLSGADITRFADELHERLRLAVGDPIAVADLHEEIRAFRGRAGDWPSCYAGPVGRFGVDWRCLDQYLRRGSRGLGPGSTLLEECRRAAAGTDWPPPVHVASADRWTEAGVREAIREYLAAHGRFPTKGEVSASPLGPKWSVVDLYLREGGWHGLPGGSTLAEQVRFVQQELGQLPGPVLLTEESVQAAVIAYREASGHYPDRASAGEVLNLGGAWGTLNNRLRAGALGAPTSLAEVVRGVQEGRNETALPAVPPLTLQAIAAAVKAFRHATGRAPTRASREPSGLGISWGSLDNLLKRGGRGLPPGSSLARVARAVLTAAVDPHPVAPQGRPLPA